MPNASSNWTIRRKPRRKTIWQVHGPDGLLVCECSSEAFASLIAKLLQNDAALRNVSCSTNPDVSVNASFVPYGYQMDILVNGVPRSIACRDFAGSHEIPVLVESFIERAERAIEAFRKGTDDPPEAPDDES